MLNDRPSRAASFCKLAVATMFGCFGFMLLVGCDRADEIKHYTVTKPSVLEKEYYGANGRPQQAEASPIQRATNGTDGMMGAIVPRGEQLWFFKLVGPNKAVEAQATSFARFIDSFNFKEAADSPPEWKLPEGWTQEPGSGMRYATIKVDSAEKPLEMSVITFPKPPGDEESAILLNVNRWRGQLGLEKITRDQLADQSKTVKLPFGRAVVVYFVGHMQAGGMGGPMAGGGPFSGGAAPFAGGELPADHPPISATGDQGPENPAPPESGPAPTYVTPASWQPQPNTGLRKAAFVVRDGDKKVEITVIALPLFAGDLLDNVNRWRDQVHLNAIKADELSKLVKPISIGGKSASYVELIGPAEPAPRQTLLGVLAARTEQVWFIKLLGDAPLAEREKANFEAFVKSIKFASP
jgi:hypothetical protein